MKIAVVGAGIIGVSSAYRIKCQYNDIHIDVLAERFSPNTTSDTAAGFWEPYIAADTDKELLKRWSKETYDYVIQELKTNAEAGVNGLMLTHGFNLSENEFMEKPHWSDIVYDFKMLKKDEIRKRFPSHVKSGFAFTTVFIETNKYIPWLMKKAQALGVNFIQRKLTSLDELYDSYDIIVNCSGLGSKELINDTTMYPVRGQVMKVRAPWVKHFMIMDGKDTTCYILPNQDYCVVGGTKYVNNSDITVSEDDRQWIFSASKKLIPSLQYGEHIKDVVGLRPCRNIMRVESESVIVKTPRGVKEKKIIHNYGHGGSGVTVSWGCAGDTVSFVSQCIGEMKNFKSKL